MYLAPHVLIGHFRIQFLKQGPAYKKEGRILIKDLSNKWKYKTKEARLGLPSEILVNIYIYIPDCKISLSFFVLLCPSSPGPLYQNEVKCSAFDMQTIFHSHANKTNFHKKGCALGLILKARAFESEVFLSLLVETGPLF